MNFKLSRAYIILFIVSVAFLLSFYQESMIGIELKNWRVTLPVDHNNDGKPDSYGPDEMNEALATGSLKPYFYKSDDGALVFFCELNSDIATTPNSKYPRSELREHMVPNNYHVNWYLESGGTLKGKLQVTKTSPGARFMVMQIHGRLTKDQKEKIQKKDYDAPPLLKVYYNDGRIEVAHKVLKDKSLTGDKLLIKSNWTDAPHYYFKENVENSIFNLEISASTGVLKVKLNGIEKEFTDPDLLLYPFVNYFKAGNYLTTRTKNAYSEVKYYRLEIEH